MTGGISLRLKLFLLGGTGLAAVALSSAEALAQAAFCPPDPGVRGFLGDPTQPPAPGVTVIGEFGPTFFPRVGTCTNGINGVGAFSSAAVASQTLSSLTESSTRESNRAAGSAVAERRATEQARPAPAATPRAAPEPAAERPARREARRRAAATPPARDEAPAARARRRAAAPEVAEAPAPAPRGRVRRAEPVEALPPARRARPIVRKGYDPEPPPVMDYPPPIHPLRFAAFANVFGEWERRRGSTGSTLTYLTPLRQAANENGGVPQTTGVTLANGQELSGVITTPLTILAESRTSMGGFVGGLDMTSRSLISPNDGLILGLLTGYMVSDVRVRTSTLSSNPLVVGNGFGDFRAHLTGPSAGAFATYFNGPFSADLTAKFDFLNLAADYTNLLAFSGVPSLVATEAAGSIGIIDEFACRTNVAQVCYPIFQANALNRGRFDTGLVQGNLSGNVNYRIPLTYSLWTEPTAGFQYTASYYNSSASFLGLSDGHSVRLQGGLRLGADFFLGSMRVTPVVTGLAYETVIQTGGFIQTGAFGTPETILRDKGKLRGQGIFGLNFDGGNGVTSFVQADVRGGRDFFGFGGRAGIRYQW